MRRPKPKTVPLTPHEDFTWTCKDGTVMKLAEMSDNHLKNALALMERETGWRRSSIPYIKEEINRRRKWH